MRVPRQRKDAILSGAAICALSLAVFILLWPLPAQPKIFPLCMNAFVGIGGLFLICRAWLQDSDSNAEEAAAEAEGLVEAELSVGADRSETSERPIPSSPPWAVMTFIAACFLVMPYLGFALTLPLLVFGLLCLAGVRRHLFMAVLTFALVAVAFIGFRLILYISIPEGIFDPTEYVFRFFGI